MKFTIEGKQIDVGDALRTHVEEQLLEKAEKYFADPMEATVVFSRDAHLYRCVISIRVGHNVKMDAHGEASEPYPAFDITADKVAKRLRRYKRRLKDHHLHSGKAVEPAAYAVFDVAGESAEDEGAEQPLVVADMQSQVETLAVSDAVMRLELGDLPALMFRNPAHGGLNMIYRRRDGNVGWVDPAGNANPSGR